MKLFHKHHKNGFKASHRKILLVSCFYGLLKISVEIFMFNRTKEVSNIRIFNFHLV